MGPLGFQNLYALAMRRDQAESRGIDSIEDLIPIANELVAAGDMEFFGRPEWLTIRDTYNIDFARKLTFDPSLMYTAIDEGQVDLITAYTSDGRVAAFDLVILDDPRNALLPYDAILVTSAEIAGDNRAMAVLAKLENAISDDLMRQASRIVDVDGGSVAEAVSFLRRQIGE